MDVVSSAASVIAIIQLCENIKKLLAFGKAVQDAPANVGKLFQDLELLNLVVLQARNIINCFQFDEISERAIQNCENKIFALLQKLGKAQLDFQTGSLRLRKWSAFKITLKADEITSLRVSIEEAKSVFQIVQNKTILECLVSVDQKQRQTLLEIETIRQLIREASPRDTKIVKENMHIYTIQQPNILSEYQKDPQDPEASFHAVAGDVTGLPHLLNSTSVGEDLHFRAKSMQCTTLIQSSLLEKRELRASKSTTYQTPLFKVHNETRTYNVLRKVDADSWTTEDMESRYFILPSAGSKFFGLRRGIIISAKSCMGWKYTIQPFRLVPDDSLIFEFCRTGNEGGLRALLKRGYASPWDRNAEGQTPLWIAAQALQPEIAKILLQEGADPNECDWKYNAEPIYGIVKNPNIAIEPKLAMIRILQSHKHQEIDTSTSLQMMGRFILDYRAQKSIPMPQPKRQEAVTKLLRSLLSDLHPEHPAIAELLFVAVRYYYSGPPLKWILTNMKGDSETPDGRNSVLYEAIGMRLLERDYGSMRSIVQRTQDLHRAVQVGHWTQERETPTAQAMRDMHNFLLWRRMLLSLQFDINAFVKEELAVTGGVAIKGWHEQSLAYLFLADESLLDGLEYFAKRGKFGFPVCDRCGDQTIVAGQRLLVDLAWRQRLRYVRLGRFDVNIAPACGKASAQPSPNDTASVYTQAEWIPERGKEADGQKDSGKQLPYRIVCSRACTDGVCVAWIFEDDGETGDTPTFPAFTTHTMEEENRPSVKNLEMREEEVEVCPTKRMPGAFVD